MRAADYWEKRALDREAASRREADRTTAKVYRAYYRAQKSIESDIKRIYTTYSDGGRLTRAEMDKLMTANESKQVLDDLRQQLATIKSPKLRQEALDRLNAKAYAARIKRLEAVKENIRTQMAKIADAQQQAMDSQLNKVVADTYYRSIFDAQQGTGMGFGFSELPYRAINEILSEKFAGSNYSSRIWSNTTLLAQEAEKILTSGIIAGTSIQRMSKQLDDVMWDGRLAATRLIRTETNRAHNAAQLEAYKEMEVKRYRFLATLDAATCTVCGKLDNKTFDVSEARQGVNYPPMHPNDRCTTVEAFDGEDLSRLKRRARDPETGKTYLVPADMTYEQWRKQDTEKRGYDAVKAAQNAKSDKEQYSRYKKLLGKENVPKTLAEFQKMKYDIHGAEEYKVLKSKYRKAVEEGNLFKSYSSAIKSGELTPLANFELYKDVSRQMDKVLVGIETSNGIKITGKSKHSIARIIGSVEQRRNGVKVSDVLDALTNPNSEITPVNERKNGRGQKFINKAVGVTVNPDTGNIIQVNPTHSRKNVKS